MECANVSHDGTPGAWNFHGAAEDARRRSVGGRARRRRLETLDPATEQVLTTVPLGGVADVDRAVRAARAAFEPGSPWRRLSPSQRGRLIHRLGDLVLEHAEELALTESRDNGKPVAYAAMADIPMAADLFHYMSGWTTKIEGNTIPFSAAPPGSFLSYTTREPIGVVGQIIPWNFP